MICTYYSFTIFGFIYYIREKITIYSLTNYIRQAFLTTEQFKGRAKIKIPYPKN